MNSSPARENILRRIRKALSHPVPLPFPESENGKPIFNDPEDELAVVFAQTFTQLQGMFAYCENQEDLAQQLSALIREREWKEVYCVEQGLIDKLSASGLGPFSKLVLSVCDVSVTTCEYLVARTGSIVMSSAQESGRTTSVYAPIHICIAYTSQLVYDIKDALKDLRIRYKTNLPSFITFATGPSRTADIEKTLVVGVHGPAEVYCFLVEG
jgi:L-lactate dehydrogenase complex protein LldG